MLTFSLNKIIENMKTSNIIPDCKRGATSSTSLSFNEMKYIITPVAKTNPNNAESKIELSVNFKLKNIRPMASKMIELKNIFSVLVLEISNFLFIKYLSREVEIAKDNCANTLSKNHFSIMLINF